MSFEKIDKEVSHQKLQQHLRLIAHPRDPFENFDFLAEVQNYIEQEFISYGYTVERFSFPFAGKLFEHVIARPSCFRDESSVIIGAHFDAVPGTDGADDNASGVAALLEAARLLSKKHRTRNIEFVAFNIEEYSMTGSTHYVKHLKKQSRKLKGMISLEMVAFTSQAKGSQNLPLALRPFYSDVGNFLALVGDGHSKKFLDQVFSGFKQVHGLPVEQLIVPAKGWVFPETRLSDHSPFWDAGYPAVLVTDTSFFRNPHYHLPADKIETLDMTFLAHVTEGVVYFADSFEP